MKPYVVPPAQALKEGVPLFWREGLDERRSLRITTSLLRAVEAERDRQPQRYQVHGTSRASVDEAIRALVLVGLRLREENPELFEQLRDSA